MGGRKGRKAPARMIAPKFLARRGIPFALLDDNDSGQAMATGGASFSTKIVFNGQEYASLDQMPAAQRQLYEIALKLSQDTEAIAPARKADSAALPTNRQRQLVLLFAVLVVIAVVIFLLKR